MKWTVEYLSHLKSTRILTPPFTEIDPDLQFYTESNYIHNMKCDYYLEDTFNDYFSESKTEDISASFSFKYQKFA